MNSKFKGVCGQYYVTDVDFQRNGVSGSAFKQVHFILIEDEGRAETLVATIGSDETGEKYDYTTCRVINPSVPSAAYRGDNIGTDLIKGLKLNQR